MSDARETPKPAENSATEASEESGRPKTRNRKVLLAAVGGGAVLVLAVAGIAVAVSQPTRIERAGEVCGGSKPLDSFLGELSGSGSPADATPEGQDAESQEGFDELFDGVLTVEDDGHTLIVSTKPADEDALGMTTLTLDCVYEELDVPRHVSELIGTTRALDGRQTGEWDEFSASWGYHPDNGLSLIIATK